MLCWLGLCGPWYLQSSQIGWEWRDERHLATLYFFVLLPLLSVSYLVFVFLFWLSYRISFSFFLKLQPNGAMAVKCVYHVRCRCVSSVFSSCWCHWINTWGSWSLPVHCWFFCSLLHIQTAVLVIPATLDLCWEHMCFCKLLCPVHILEKQIGG